MKEGADGITGFGKDENYVIYLKRTKENNKLLFDLLSNVHEAKGKKGSLGFMPKVGWFRVLLNECL